MHGRGRSRRRATEPPGAGSYPGCMERRAVAEGRTAGAGTLRSGARLPARWAGPGRATIYSRSPPPHSRRGPFAFSWAPGALWLSRLVAVGLPIRAGGGEEAGDQRRECHLEGPRPPPLASLGPWTCWCRPSRLLHSRLAAEVLLLPLCPCLSRLRGASSPPLFQRPGCRPHLVPSAQRSHSLRFAFQGLPGTCSFAGTLWTHLGMRGG